MNRSFRLLLSVFLLSLFAVGGVLSVARADLSTLRHTERAGRFSYYPPKGWRVAEMGGLKYRVVVGPPDGDFAPNLNVVDQKSKLSLREFAAASKQSLPKMLEEVKVLGEAPFTTRHGRKGYRLTIENRQGGKHLRQVFYLFDGWSGNKIIFTGTAPAASGPKYDALFDESMRTVRFR
ncbi:MAG TPA: hypothetical protein VM490_02535 [Armatimonadaceae bacterium]|nr:hypothetical protein [Armatimonadaceae bacterium]